MTTKQYAIALVALIVAGLVGGAVSGWWVVGQRAYLESAPGPAKAVKAEQFVLVDKEGHNHASLEIEPDGNPGLIFFDVNHNPRVVLELTGDGSGRLFLADQEGKLRTVFGLGREGRPFLHLRDEHRNIIWKAP